MTMVDYWYTTGDTTYITNTIEAMDWQAGGRLCQPTKPRPKATMTKSFGLSLLRLLPSSTSLARKPTNHLGRRWYKVYSTNRLDAGVLRLVAVDSAGRSSLPIMDLIIRTR